MKKRHPIKPLIGIACVVVLLLVAVVAIVLDSRSPDPILGIFQTESTTEQTTPNEDNSGSAQPEQGGEETAATTADEQLKPPEELPATVVIPAEKDPQTGESTGISFPCEVPGYGLVIEKLAPYAGMFVEDGSNAAVEAVAMLMVHNKGDFPVEYTQISVRYGQEDLIFDISALPVGERLVAQEKSGKPVPAGSKAEEATALVVQRANMDLSLDKVTVTDNGDNTLTITNLTDKLIPTVRVFYKYYMENEDIFVGGISFTVRITRLGAGNSVTVQPSHYTSQSSRVVMVLTYDAEV